MDQQTYPISLEKEELNYLQETIEEKLSNSHVLNRDYNLIESIYNKLFAKGLPITT